MLKEACIILALTGCILLIAPMSFWLFYYGFPIGDVKNLPLYFALLSIVLAYALIYIKKLSDNNQNEKLLYFTVSLMLAVGISFILLMVILPYFRPNLVC